MNDYENAKACYRRFGVDVERALARLAEKALSLIHISEPTRQAEISYAVFCLKKKKWMKIVSL